MLDFDCFIFDLAIFKPIDDDGGFGGFLHKGVNYRNFLIDLNMVHLLIYASKRDYGCVWSDFVKRGIEGHM